MVAEAAALIKIATMIKMEAAEAVAVAVWKELAKALGPLSAEEALEAAAVEAEAAVEISVAEAAAPVIALSDAALAV